MKRASILLVVLNGNLNEEGRVTGKIFEYLATGNIILGIGSKTSDCAKVINESHAGKMIGFDEQSHIEESVYDYFQQYLNGQLNDTLILDESRLRFTRENLTKDLGSMLDAMISE